jgi:hypothetical protein
VLHHQGDALMVEAVSTIETSVSFYQTTRHNIPEESHLQICKINCFCVMNGLCEGEGRGLSMLDVNVVTD